ncbi:MAG: hypothetical protein N2444_05715, partial [Methylocystis sp.]|nr:hypothetical protein [Methylocystis sp.]
MIVGCDLRQKPLLDPGGSTKLGEYWPTDFFRNPFLVRRRSRKQTRLLGAAVENIDHPERNMVGLPYHPHARMLSPQGAGVAFSMRPDDAENLESGRVEPIDEGCLSATPGWRLLGYDVADA